MVGNKRRAANVVRAKARKSAAPPPIVRFRMRIMSGDVIAIGPGKIALLEAVDRTGSITSAAKQLDMSYRRAWLLIDEINRCLSEPAVDSEKGGQRGGGTALTDTGRRLIAIYRRIETSATARCRSDIKQLVGMLAH